MIRLGTVGTSNICEQFLLGAFSSERFILSAVYSRKFETAIAFGEKFGCKKVFCNLEEMAKSGLIDAVYIASPNALHYEQSKIFIENKIHVLCEKAIVTKADEYSELKALADKMGVVYMEAIMPIYTDYREKVKSAFLKIGKPVLARFDFSQRSSRLDKFLSGEKVNIFDMSLHAGTLMDLGIYCVYAAIDFFGMPQAITASAHFFENGADKSGTATFLYDDFTAFLSYSKIAEGNVRSEIIGEKGVLKISSVSQYTGVYLILNGKEEKIVHFPTRTEVMSGEAKAFANYIESPDVFVSDYENNSEMTLLVHKCMDKIKSKANINYPKKGEK